MPNILDTQPVAELVTRIEEATRSTQEGIKNFVEPVRGTLTRAKSRRHHIIFGRRGSGKSSLLLKASADLSFERRPIAVIDLETFKGHSYPDVLISILITTLMGFSEWFNTIAITPSSKTTYWFRFFGKKPQAAMHNQKECKNIVEEITKYKEELEKLLYTADERPVKSALEDTKSKELKGAIGIPTGTPASINLGGQVKHDIVQKVEEEFTSKKIDILHRKIIEYRALFQKMHETSKGDCFLFLDDLYHIRRIDQPYVIDYFHRIAKGCNLWLKIGTIEHRSDWYLHKDPPIGLKVSDDADRIDLDLTLEKYGTARDFLIRILKNFLSAVNINSIYEILTEDAIDRLILASGGVARDFLTILRKAVEFAQERKGGPRGLRVCVEDVNQATGDYYTSKREELKRDTSSSDDQVLDKEFQKLVKFCIDGVNTNCFLIDKDDTGPELSLINELVDLKLLHLVRSRVTMKTGHRGKIYEAYMVDLSQYTGARKRRDLNIIDFSKTGSNEELRQAKMIYALDNN